MKKHLFAIALLAAIIISAATGPDTALAWGDLTCKVSYVNFTTGEVIVNLIKDDYYQASSSGVAPLNPTSLASWYQEVYFQRLQHPRQSVQVFVWASQDRTTYSSCDAYFMSAPDPLPTPVPGLIQP